mgnify:FL=1
MRPKLTSKIFWKTDFGERNRNIQHIDNPDSITATPGELGSQKL